MIIIIKYFIYAIHPRIREYEPNNTSMCINNLLTEHITVMSINYNYI